VVVKSGLPGLVGLPAPRPILADGGIGDGDSEFGEFGLDSLAAPGRMAGPHAADEATELAIQRGSASSPTGLPMPEQPEAQSMPTGGASREAQLGSLFLVRVSRFRTTPDSEGLCEGDYRKIPLRFPHARRHKDSNRANGL